MISNLGEIDSEIECYIYQKKKITHLINKIRLNILVIILIENYPDFKNILRKSKVGQRWWWCIWCFSFLDRETKAESTRKKLVFDMSL